MESKELLVPDPLLYEDGLEKYIWISDASDDHRNAQYLFGYLMQNNIYINGFVSESDSIIGLRMYNKKIYDLKSLKQRNAAVFYDTWFSNVWETSEDRGYKARVINPDMGRENIVIWGSGVTGEKTFRLLADAGIQVQFFVDSDKSLAGTVKCGLPVHSPEKLTQDCTIIEAMGKWRQLDEEICGRYRKRFHYSLKFIWDRITCECGDDEKEVFSLSNFWSCDRFNNKRVYIYGTGAVETAFADCLKLLDYEFAGFLADDGTEGIKDGYPVMPVEEILYEENFYVWVYDQEKSRKLRELGLRHFLEYECAVHSYGIVSDAKFCLDVNLGHTYLTDGKYPGITVYGKEKKENYKIAVLGASTTEGVQFPFESWPEILYKKLGQEGITLYNGGVSGYWLGQQMIKMMRDILPLKPDMLIVYDAYAELCNIQHPFAFPYAMTAYEYAAAHMEGIRDYERKVSAGVDSGRDRYEYWLFSVRNMYALANVNHIRFFYFCAPWLSSKNGKTIREKNMLISASNGLWFDGDRNAFRYFLNDSQMTLPDCVYDLSHIFDGEEDVYMDSCHVWEKGNRIIAEEIMKVILSEIKSYMGGEGG